MPHGDSPSPTPLGESRADNFLDSWKEIAAYLGREVRTVQRWEKKEGLPVHRQTHEKLSTVYAYKSEIDAWWKERRAQLASKAENVELVAGPQILPWPALEPEAEQEGPSKHQLFGPISRVKKHKIGALAALVFSGLVVGGTLYSARGWLWGSVSQLRVSHRQMTFLGNVYSPAISPDGAFVAFVSRRYGEQERLMVQSTNGTTLELARGAELRYPRWSPDGSELLFFSTDSTKEKWGTYVVSPLGGTVSQIITDGPYACWLASDGSQIVVAAQAEATGFKGVRLVSKATRESREIVLPGYTWLQDLDCSPRTGTILAVTQTSDKFHILTFNQSGNVRSQAEEGERIFSARWSPTGDSIYYLHGTGSTSTLSKLSITKRKEESLVLASGLPSGDLFSISSDGTKLIYARVNRSSNLWRVKWQPSENPIKSAITQLTSGTFSHAYPAYSPDGRWISFCRGPDFDSTNVFKMPLEGGTPLQVTFFERYAAVSPGWSPDGQRIAFISDQNGATKVWTVSANGGDPKILEGTDASNTSGYLAWWPSDKIVYQQPGNRNLLQVKGERDGEEPIFRSTPATGWVPYRPVFSPDGKRLAVFWNRKHAGTWIVSRDPYSETLLKEGEFYPIGWSPDGKFVYGVPKPHGRQIVRVQLAEPHAEIAVADLPGPITGYDNGAVSPDGSEIIVSIREEKSDVWVMENFDPSLHRRFFLENLFN